jgi:hypothetical protein
MELSGAAGGLEAGLDWVIINRREAETRRERYKWPRKRLQHRVGQCNGGE